MLPPRDYIGAVESIPSVAGHVEDLQAQGAVYAVDSDLYFRVRSDPAFGSVADLDARPDARDLRRARRRSRSSRQGGSARLPRVAVSATGRAGLGHPSRARPTGLAHRVRRDRAGPPRHDDRRPGRRHGPGLPAPRDERVGGAGAAPGAPVRASLRALGDGRLAGPQDVEVARATSCSCPRCATRASIRPLSGWPSSRTTTGRTGRGPSRVSTGAERAPGAVAVGRVGARRVPAPSPCWPGSARRWPTTCARRTPSMRSTPGRWLSSRAEGDDTAAPGLVRDVADALLGVRL